MAKKYLFPFTEVEIGRFLFLLTSILLLFIIRPFLSGFVAINVLFDIFFFFILISGVYAVSERKGGFVIGMILVLPAFVAALSDYVVKIPAIGVTERVFEVLFLGYTACMILAHVFRQKKVTLDTISGAICAYFLIGFVWGLCFSLLEQAQPGSFLMAEQQVDPSHFIYYSFVTMSTLGYGDITPISNPARSLSLLEAVVGQLYIAILIAKLVGMHIAQAQRGHGG
jgi:hypothetical protein